MKTLHILKTEPDADTKVLMAALGASQDEGTNVFKLYEEQADYEELLNLIFANDKVISWW
ncbi:MAG: hypothetical protein GY864_04505 [Desulfobacterales bacterium]|nr:hypothetical protein [Desulfobacterales bacterium]